MCVCVCERERESESETIAYIKVHQILKSVYHDFKKKKMWWGWGWLPQIADLDFSGLESDF